MTDNKLARILNRITYRMPWENWDLNESEYEEIDQATGEEIMDIAYKNQLHIPTMFRNADDLIDSHNEKQMRKVVQDLKLLKLDVLSNKPRLKRPEIRIPETEAVERRFLQEAIEEVLGSAPDQEETVENEQGSVQVTNAFERLDVAGPSATDELLKLAVPDEFLNPRISDHRGQNQANVTMNEAIPINMDEFGEAEGFGEANLEEVAKLGFFEGEGGRDLYNRISNRPSRRTFGPVLTPVIEKSNELQESAPIPQPNTPTDLEQPFAATIPRLNAVKIPFPQDESVPLQNVQTPKQIPSNEKTVSLPQNDRVMQATAPIPELEIETLETVQSKQAHNASQKVSANTMKRSDFLKEVFAKNEGKPKRRRKVNREKKKPDSDTLKLHRALKSTQKPRQAVSYFPKIHLGLAQGIFKHLADFISDDDLDTSEQHLPSESQVNVPAAEIQQVHPDDLILETEDVHESKRPRLNMTDENIQPIEIHSIIPTGTIPKVSALNKPFQVPKLSLNAPFHVPKASLTAPEASVPRQSLDILPSLNYSPITSFKPVSASTAQKTHESRVTADDEAFENLRDLSKLSSQLRPSIGVDGAQQNLGHSSQNILGSVAKQADYFTGASAQQSGHSSAAQQSGQSSAAQTKKDAAPVYFRQVSGRTEKMIEFVGVNGTVERYSEYCLETVVLYMQIRFIMKRNNSWKLPFAQLLPLIGLNKKVSDHIIENRIHLLADYNLLKLKLSEDEEQIIEVEIPIVPKPQTN